MINSKSSSGSVWIGDVDEIVSPDGEVTVVEFASRGAE